MTDRYTKAFPVSWDQLHRDSKALAWRLADKGPCARTGRTQRQWLGLPAASAAALSLIVGGALLCASLIIVMAA